MPSNITGDYLSVPLAIDAVDNENRAYFGYCHKGEFRLQACASCRLLRYPPTTGCPWCGYPESSWLEVPGRGTVYSYAEVHHAIQPAFKDHLPYLILIVELDTQRGQPQTGDAIRVTGNLAAADGQLAKPEAVAKVGIGSRVRMVFKSAGKGIAVPHWTLDEEAQQPGAPWRYPE